MGLICTQRFGGLRDAEARGRGDGRGEETEGEPGISGDLRGPVEPWGAGFSGFLEQNLGDKGTLRASEMTGWVVRRTARYFCSVCGSA